MKKEVILGLSLHPRGDFEIGQKLLEEQWKTGLGTIINKQIVPVVKELSRPPLFILETPDERRESNTLINSLVVEVLKRKLRHIKSGAEAEIETLRLIVKPLWLWWKLFLALRRHGIKVKVVRSGPFLPPWSELVKFIVGVFFPVKETSLSLG